MEQQQGTSNEAAAALHALSDRELLQVAVMSEIAELQQQTAWLQEWLDRQPPMAVSRMTPRPAKVRLRRHRTLNELAPSGLVATA